MEALILRFRKTRAERDQGHSGTYSPNRRHVSSRNKIGVVLNYSTRQGERSGQWRIASLAHSGVLSVWQVLQAFGTLSCVVIDGGTNRKVCERTLMSAICVATFGMWHDTHS